LNFKFLLVAVNAKYIHSNPAIYSLRAYSGEELQQYVELAEYTINQSMQDILADIYRRKPDAIGFSCYIWNWEMVEALLTEIRKLLPDTALWLGGPEVSYDADVILRRCPELTGIMVGEGEETFRELLGYYVNCVWVDGGEMQAERLTKEKCSDGPESLLKEESLIGQEQPLGSDSLAGTEPSTEVECIIEKEQLVTAEGRFVRNKNCFRESVYTGTIGRPGKCPGELGEINGLCLPTGYTAPRLLTDMNAIPFLYDDLTPFKNKIIYYETSRGCPFRCSYCLSSIDKAVRLRDLAIVRKELQFFLDHQVKQVKFVDRTFNCNHDHAMAIWQYIHDHDNGVTNFHFEISADILREDEIVLLNCFRPGLVQLEIGVQSANPETLRAIKRVMDVDKLEKIVGAIRQGGNIHQHLDLIAGLPYEDYNSFRESFNRVYRMHPDQLQLGFLKVLKGSEMWERAEEYGIRYLSRPPYEVLSTRWLPYEDVLRLKGIEEMVELYDNSAQFTHTLPFLEKAFSDPFAMYEALADFYRREGYLTTTSSRIYRYQVLLAFAAEWDSPRLEIYRELLTYDLYLRENLKSRPEFARDLSEWKDTARKFYQAEERNPHYLTDYAGYDWKQLSKMTHLEPFAYPVWDVGQMLEGYGKWSAGRGEDFCEPKYSGAANGMQGYRFVLFDYQWRNPLNGEARSRCVEM